MQGISIWLSCRRSPIFELVISSNFPLCWKFGRDFKHSLTYFSALCEPTRTLSGFFYPKNWQNLGKHYFAGHQVKGERRKRERIQVRSPKTQIGSQRGKGTNYAPETPPVVRSISGKGRDRPVINTGSKDSTSLVWSDTIPTLVPLDVNRDMSFYISLNTMCTYLLDMSPKSILALIPVPDWYESF
jgi:hypothetical protein